jgi:hypothetical protein
MVAKIVSETMKTNFMLSRFIAREELTGLLRLFCGDI